MRSDNTLDNPSLKFFLSRYFKTIKSTSLINPQYNERYLNEALAWYVVYDGDDLVGISGIQVPKYFKKDRVARIIYRTYISPDYRGKGMTCSRANWDVTGDQQIKFCNDNGYHPVFSRENVGASNATRNICRYANQTSELKWRVLDGYYFTGTKLSELKRTTWLKIIGLESLQPVHIPTMTDEQFQRVFHEV